MAGKGVGDDRTRIEELEQTVRELRARVQRLEGLLGPRVENPKDDAVVRRKVVYDWQA